MTIKIKTYHGVTGKFTYVSFVTKGGQVLEIFKDGRFKGKYRLIKGLFIKQKR